jgi:hypothetical protein
VGNEGTSTRTAVAAPESGPVVRLSWDEVRNHGQYVVVPAQDPKLPLADIPPEAFERLCAEIVDRTSGDNDVHIYGRRGQRQFGLDIVEFGTRAGGGSSPSNHVYQVKRYQEMKPAELRAAVKLYADSDQFEARKFTVMTSAPTDDRRLIDEVGALREEYADQFEVRLLGPDRIQTLLRELPNTVRAVFGRAMAEALCGQPGVEPPQLLHAISNPELRMRTLLTAMRSDFTDDDPIRFNEAELVGPSVDLMFVDVPVVAHPRTLAGRLLADIEPNGVQVDWDQAHQLTSNLAPELLEPVSSPEGVGTIGPIQLRIGETTYESLSWAGGAQALLHPGWLASTVILGGPGQGKSTLLQYVCQEQRARHLGEASYDPDLAKIRPTAAMPRIPFRIDLRLYARWRRKRLENEAARGRKRQKSGKRRPKPQAEDLDINDLAWLKELSPEVTRSVLLETYVCELVSTAAGGATFGIDDLVAVASRWPILFALDGLDEVAPIVDRIAVSDLIREFQARYNQAGVDVIIVVTSRPGVVERPLWEDRAFAVLELGEMVDALKMRYIEKWAISVELPAERRTTLLAAFEAERDKPHVREVSSNPMQLAILCRLLDRRTVIPAQRTKLYDEYINVFFDREFDKNDTISEYRDTLAKIHAYVGWWMHTAAERGESNGTIDLPTLRELLHEYLAGIGEPTQMVDELYNEMKSRVICLVQRKQASGLFEFEVQGIREYFAARYLIDEVVNTAGTKGDRLRETIRRPYWSNVMRFAAGRFTGGELPEIVYVCRELEENEFARQPLPRAAAKQLLDDHVFATMHQSVVKDLLIDATAGTGIFLALDGLSQPGSSSSFTFPPGPTAQALVAVLQARIAEPGSEPDRRAAAVLLCRQIDRPDADQGSRADVWEWWWTGPQAVSVRATDPALWVKVASDLRLLSDLTAQEEQQLVGAIVRASDAAGESTLELLARGGRWSPGDALHDICIQELADGAADGYIPSAPATEREEDADENLTPAPDPAVGLEPGIANGTESGEGSSTAEDQLDPEDEFDPQGRRLISGSLGQLVRAAGVDRYVESEALLGSGSGTPVAKKPVRRRLRGHDRKMRASVEALDLIHDQFRSGPTTAGWVQLLDASEDVWGDSWILRAILMNTPRASTQAVNLASEATTGARNWPSLAHWLADAHVHHGDPDWWRAQFQELGELSGTEQTLTSMFRLATAVAYMNAFALFQIGPELNRACDELTRGNWAAVAAACARASRRGSRALHLSQQVRTTFSPSPRLASLLLTRADESTVNELVRYLLPAVADLWRTSPSVDALLRQLLQSALMKLKLTHLKSARGSLPVGSLRGYTSATRLTIGEAEQILADPATWPPDVVRSAAERLETAITAKLPELGKVAAERGWKAPGL